MTLFGSETATSAVPHSYLCQCGCGEPTPLAKVTSSKRGWVKGQPIRFIRGHSVRVTNRTRRGVERVEVTTEDRGFHTPCHIWQGTTRASGYCTRGDHAGGIVTTHRYAYEHAYGPIPAGLEVHHLCQVKRCVNPEHLVALTRQQHVWMHRHGGTT